MKLVSADMMHDMLAGTPRHIDLVEFFTSRSGVADIFIALFDTPVTYGADSQSYIPVGFSELRVRQSAADDGGNVPFAFPDIDRQLAMLFHTFDLGDVRVLVRRISRHPIQRELILFDGVIKEWSIGDSTGIVQASHFAAKYKDTTLPRRITQLLCNAQFGDDSCTVDLSAHSFMVTTRNGTTARLLVFEEGTLAAAGADSSWLPMSVKSTSGRNINEVRQVASLGTVTGSHDYLLLMKPFLTRPVGRDNQSDDFYVQRACVKSMDVCEEDYENLPRYQGYPYVPKDPLNLRQKIGGGG